MDGYNDYHDKMTTYVAIISSPAQLLNSDADPRVHGVSEMGEEDSVFRYMDTASSKAGINNVTMAGYVRLPFCPSQ